MVIKSRAVFHHLSKKYVIKTITNIHLKHHTIFEHEREMVFFTHALTEINKQNKVKKSFTDAKQFLALCYSVPVKAKYI